MSTTAVTLEELESERADLLPSRETMCWLPPMWLRRRRGRHLSLVILPVTRDLPQDGQLSA